MADSAVQLGVLASRLETAVSPLGVLRSSRDLVKFAHQLEHQAIHQAREEDFSWASIGAALGVSAQAAQQRFSRGK